MSTSVKPSKVPKIPFNLEEFDHKEIHFNDYLIHVYNSSSLGDYLKNFNVKKESTDLTEIPLNVLYLLHGRGIDYKYKEAVGTFLAEKYYKTDKVKIPLIFVTFDLPNHGIRAVNEKPTDTWETSNTYAIDLVNNVDTAVINLKLVMDYLPFYLNLDLYVLKLTDYKFQFHNIITGYSMGAHIIHRFATFHPDYVDIIFPIVGSSDLSSLLIDRLFKREHTGAKQFLKDYEDLGFNDEQKKLYPRSFHNYLKKIDERVFENFPVGKVKMFAAFGAKDKLVPPEYSKLFVELVRVLDPDTEVFVQEDSGHAVTHEMLDKFFEWLLKFI